MAAGTDLTEFIKSDLTHNANISIPLKAGFIERLLVRYASIDNLHVNPADEFCFKDIGPNYSIISEYEQKIRKGQRFDNSWLYIKEPLIVLKIYPTGYMLLNGHHRWAAAKRANLKWVPVNIINITTEDDIEKMLSHTSHTKRATIDLDEVVFCSENDEYLEKKLPFPLSHIYRERLRLGIPALFNYLRNHEYDIWVYTSKYYSPLYIKSLFLRHHVHLTGIITGSSRTARLNTAPKRKIEQMFRDKYTKTLNIYADMLLLIPQKTYEYEQYDLDSSSPEWAVEVKKVIEEIEKKL
ncbi:MAG: ParB/Srx family N-terminal domain-containing protein [Lachnospiraceae bacterium]|nr:ParB/Srx family N-terminal domain-containing protein [Lachnospiraceae bacterium]